MEERIRIDANRVEAREIEGELIMLDLGRQVYMRANRTATRLWPLLTAGTTRDELVSRLTTQFSVDRALAERDVDEFLKALAERGLLAEEP